MHDSNRNLRARAYTICGYSNICIISESISKFAEQVMQRSWPNILWRPRQLISIRPYLKVECALNLAIICVLMSSYEFSLASKRFDSNFYKYLYIDNRIGVFSPYKMQTESGKLPRCLEDVVKETHLNFISTPLCANCSQPQLISSQLLYFCFINFLSVSLEYSSLFTEIAKLNYSNHDIKFVLF